jgi:hypothetical protein
MPIPTFTKLGPKPEFNDLVNKINTIVAELINIMLNMDSLNVVSLTADHIDTGTLDAGVVTIRGEDGTVFYQIDSTGIVANNGTIDTLKFDLATGLLTVVSMLIKSSNSDEKVSIDSTGFHSFDSSGVERLTIGTTPAKGAKALVGRDSAGAVQSAYTYDTETVDGASRIGQFITAHAAYLLLSDDGDIRFQNDQAGGFRVISTGRPEFNINGGTWRGIAEVGANSSITSLSGLTTPLSVSQGGTGANSLTGILKGNGTSAITAVTPLAGTKTYYVSDTSGGAVTRKLTFTDGILTSET